MEMPDSKASDVNVYNFENWLNSGFSTNVTCAFLRQENIYELSESNTLKHRK